MKLAYFLSCELRSRMKEEILVTNEQRRIMDGVYEAIHRAVMVGNFELVSGILEEAPSLLWSHDAKSTSIFSAAVQYRHARVFSLIYCLDIKIALARATDSFHHNNLLHVAGMLAPSTSLDRIAGAALQMQRELQWFKVISLT